MGSQPKLLPLCAPKREIFKNLVFLVQHNQYVQSIFQVLVHALHDQIVGWLIHPLLDQVVHLQLKSQLLSGQTETQSLVVMYDSHYVALVSKMEPVVHKHCHVLTKK